MQIPTQEELCSTQIPTSLSLSLSQKSVQTTLEIPPPPPPTTIDGYHEPPNHLTERNILIGAESSESTSRIQWRKISQSILS